MCVCVREVEYAVWALCEYVCGVCEFQSYVWAYCVRTSLFCACFADVITVKWLLIVTAVAVGLPQIGCRNPGPLLTLIHKK